MKRRKILDIIVKAIKKIVIAGCIGVSIFLIGANANRIEVKAATTINQQATMAKNRVLIYHSHTGESYIDGYDVVQAGNDLASKLEKKGIVVDHITEKFDVVYDNSYFNSRKVLQKVDLDSYDLVIDLHRDAASSTITAKDIYGNDISKLMFVHSTEQNNSKKQCEITDSLRSFGTVFSDDMIREDWNYDHGISHFNQDLNDNVILIENGFNTNTRDQVKKSNTYLAEMIAKYIKNL